MEGPRMRLPSSSPGRAGSEKFPPPLMRFLRSSINSKSTNRARPRSKSRANPLFFRRKRASAIAESQEPSSPKVTCIGQVRVRRSKNNSNNGKRKRKNPRRRGRCGCLNISLSNFCCHFGLRNRLRKWVSFFCCGSHLGRAGSSANGPNRADGCAEEAGEETGEERESVGLGRETEDVMGSGGGPEEGAPPRNALLLTRCRSAPYRSSSLACRLWSEERESEERGTGPGPEEERDSEGGTRGPLGNTEGQKEEEQQQETEEKLEREREGEEAKAKAKVVVVDVVKDEGEERERERRPLMILMRCKSEPARRGCGGDGEELNPLTAEFWKNRRLSNTESSSCTRTRANNV